MLYNVNRYFIASVIILLAIGNAVIDHLYAPIGIETTPPLIIVTTAAIVFNKQKFYLYFQMLIVYLPVAINDVGIKLFGGGIHDLEGLLWIHLLLFAGLIPAFIILLISTLSNKNAGILKQITSLLFFISLIIIHLFIFEKLGLGRAYPIN